MADATVFLPGGQVPDGKPGKGAVQTAADGKTTQELHQGCHLVLAQSLTGHLLYLLRVIDRLDSSGQHNDSRPKIDCDHHRNVIYPTTFSLAATKLLA